MPYACNFLSIIYHFTRWGIDEDRNRLSSGYSIVGGILYFVQWRAEVLGCPRKYFLFIPQNFRRPFLSVVKFHGRTIRSLDAPSRAASCLGNDIFLFIFCHLPTFFYIKLAPWMPPRVDARGRRTVRTPSARHCACVYATMHDVQLYLYACGYVFLHLYCIVSKNVNSASHSAY